MSSKASEVILHVMLPGKYLITVISISFWNKLVANKIPLIEMTKLEVKKKIN